MKRFLNTVGAGELEALWRGLLDGKPLRPSPDGPRILMGTVSAGLVSMATVESALAVALTLRGARVSFLACDAVLPACLLAERREFPDVAEYLGAGREDLCRACQGPGSAALAATGLPVLRLGSFLEEADHQWADSICRETPREVIPAYRYDGMALGEHALAGALRFFGRGDLRGEPHAEAMLRRYFLSSLLMARGTLRLLDQQRPEAAVFHHGIYVPQGILGEAMRARRIPVVNWNPSYRKGTFIFSHGNTYHRTLMDEPTSLWKDLPWPAERDQEIMDYLESRRYGTNDWIWFHDKPSEDIEEISRRLGLDFSKPTVGMLTNVIWDAQLHYPQNAFKDILDWGRRTLDYFMKRPDLQLVVRVHPAEIRGKIPSRQPFERELRAHAPDLPPNIVIIPPDWDISTYAVAEHCDAVIIYGTKTGVELTSRGIPVIVAGEAWIRNKGLTTDVSSPEEYFRILDSLPWRRRLSPALVKQARKYAYHFFFRRMMPLPFVKPTGGLPFFRLDLDDVAELGPGVHPGLDAICRGILSGEEFVHRAELSAPESRA